MKTKTQFTFDAVHRLVGHEDKNNNLHGHMWLVEVEVEGKDALNDIGMLYDSINVKKIKEQLDNKIILKVCKENQDLVYTITKTCGSEALFLMHDNPTVENLAKYICDTIKFGTKNLMFKVRVFESPNSYAEVER